MDANLFYAMNLFVFVAFILAGALRSRNDFLRVAFPFIAGAFAIIVAATVNTDGGLTTPTISTWPALYIPIFGSILNFGMAAYNGTS